MPAAGLAACVNVRFFSLLNFAAPNAGICPGRGLWGSGGGASAERGETLPFSFLASFPICLPEGRGRGRALLRCRRGWGRGFVVPGLALSVVMRAPPPVFMGLELFRCVWSNR